MNDDIPYLLRGVTPVSTDSSILVSSSKYLNDPRLREWIATQFLRKNGPDYPSPYAAYSLLKILEELMDEEAVDAMIQAERSKNPKLDAWFRERFVSSFVKEDLAKYRPDTVGGIFYSQLQQGFEINILPEFEPKSDFEYFRRRALQTHDFEHIISGGGPDAIGEMIPAYVRLTNLHTHMSPALATELSMIHLFSINQIIFRSFMHYPDTWLTAIECIQRGCRIGQQSDLIITHRYEDVFDMTVAEARKVLGVRGAEDINTSQVSLLTEPWRIGQAAE